ncbi:benzoate/H(+) symporter BenE family transporter [Nocardioides daphniae]|uniref:Benzoate transporter n=1 Tax=Nocardioides daphniae TaxID=402297 RepID=A0A4P7UBN4_9ACTN|nr:benzoate/H(+) symporter BenE family transporter [Nocardioides daphniae]QCC77563.1 benzoate/H(+) symporter BenE family transporter [Nocardioides daphniae]GGD30757.1 benzoate transporter [Nocardioides daphniae]
MERRALWTSGAVAVVVGFTSSAVVVLAGLDAVGATPSQAASGLLVLCLFSGLGTLWLSSRHRVPVLLAWSTPGAALLASTGGDVPGGWPAAVGAFVVTGLLVLLTGLVPRLGDLMAAIPVPVAQAMLAGVLFELCLGPVRGLAETPLLVAPVVVVWLLGTALRPRLAAPLAFMVALAVMGAEVARSGGWSGPVAPQVDLVVPSLTWGAVVSLAVPLYVVTMASQNVPGVAVLAAHGYRAPWRDSMLTTGALTALGAAAGGHAVNLAAITAALVASEEAGPDPAQRWRAARAAGWTYVVLAGASTALATLVALGPATVVAAVAGLALLGTLASALQGALAQEASRLPAVLTFVVAASGVVVLGLGAAFWSLVVGLVVHALVVRRVGVAA